MVFRVRARLQVRIIEFLNHCLIACSQAEGDIKKPKYYKNVGIAWLAQDGFKVWSQMDYPIEFIHALACFSLSVSPDAPESILSKYLEGPF